ncbi:5-bromo-4-chloroindolyl phosphate hydrolysis family protein [Qingshengfaniella alkalisoli]|uniref:5-bromo-4-chloroindolyl phosphate hydrolysis protein n=1 Tax=Qingshengfaniella alkalisoli TaxID=2599296 RepID=A0A5B8IXJ9_9RHOB|nr:5-bromo-4-chloroindolyl phosphate hydrolysis family protein [Qingshengfaniella alkalisoli]QDY69641.1 hypothetical protein FPZ52_08415 [Qingshengfaniella alkalisoli]
MAQKYGGRFSPDTKDTDDTAAPALRHPFQSKSRTRAGMRSNLLFVLPFFFLPAAFTSGPTGLALNLAAFGSLLLSAWLTRDGLIAQENYEARKIARRPAIPRKLFGSVLLGLGLGISGIADDSLGGAVIFGALGTGLHLLSFGLDPMKNKGMSDVDRFQSDRVSRAVDEAERHLSDMSEAIKRTGDRRLEGMVDGFTSTAREMFRTVEEDPRDLTGARKFLGVYLLGAKDATVKFADLYSKTRDRGARDDYVALLNDLESNFAAKTQTLLLDNRTDLDVEIEVLRERLEREKLG